MIFPEWLTVTSRGLVALGDLPIPRGFVQAGFYKSNSPSVWFTFWEKEMSACNWGMELDKYNRDS